MPRFFNSQELNPEQKAKWNQSVKGYQDVLERNAQAQLRKMSEQEKREFMSSFQITDFTDEDVLAYLKEHGNLMVNNPGNEKSALFFRLLSGLKPLKHAPPTSFAYPEYEVIESNTSLELAMVQAQEAKEWIKEKVQFADSQGRGVLINQSYWKVLEVVSPTHLKLTYGGWEKEGFVWEAQFTTIPAKDSVCRLICHHDPSISHISTYEQLLNEEIYHVKEDFKAISIAQDAHLYQQYQLELLTQDEEMVELIAQQKLNQGFKMIQQRIEKGLPAYPDEAEIVSIAEQRVQENYLQKDYILKDGELHKKTWLLKRVFPHALSDEHYIDL